MSRLNPDLPVLCKPVIPHKLKMGAKKILRKLNSHSDGWRTLIDKSYEELFDEEGNLKDVSNSN